MPFRFQHSVLAAGSLLLITLSSIPPAVAANASDLSAAKVSPRTLREMRAVTRSRYREQVLPFARERFSGRPTRTEQIPAVRSRALRTTVERDVTLQHKRARVRQLQKKSVETVPAAQGEEGGVSLSRNDHIIGNRNAQISLITYTDFECPYCRELHGVFKELLELYGAKINVAYRHFPLSFHANAMNAAQASECVAAQGGDEAFAAFVDRLAKNGPEPDQYSAWLPKIGIDSGEFVRCMDSERFTNRINAGIAEAESLGVSATPTTFVIDHLSGTTLTVEGYYPVEHFREAIDAVLVSD